MVKLEADPFLAEFKSDQLFTEEINKTIRNALETTKEWGVTSQHELELQADQLFQAMRVSLVDTRKAGEQFRDSCPGFMLYSMWRHIFEALNLLKAPADTYTIETALSPSRRQRLESLGWAGRPNIEIAMIKLLKAADFQHIAKTLFFEYRNVSRQGTQASSQRWKDAKDLCVEIASDAWSEDVDQPLRIGEVANNILRVIAADPSALGLKSIPAHATVKRWIRVVAPEAATKRGRSKK
ncbi:MAG: hypothetical protein GYB33_04915 [Gammaproteobacteria bacterium]|nr:hypothetical protein [Gammaproteobacteria bacterium]